VRQIKLDVHRTFRPFNLKFLNADVDSGNNKLFNLLKVYALFLDPSVAYTQGMNFIAGVILMNCPNEALACQIFTKVLQKDNWARMYLSSTPKLFDLSQQLTDLIKTEIPLLYQHLFEYQIFLEVLLASPLMTLFGNSLSFAEATHVMSLFILDGEASMKKIIMNVYKNMSAKVIEIKDQFEIQAYMSKQIYDDALEQGLFYC